jgi:hypothetical protein
VTFLKLVHCILSAAGKPTAMCLRATHAAFTHVYVRVVVWRVGRTRGELESCCTC